MTSISSSHLFGFIRLKPQKYFCVSFWKKALDHFCHEFPHVIIDASTMANLILCDMKFDWREISYGLCFSFNQIKRNTIWWKAPNSMKDISFDIFLVDHVFLFLHSDISLFVWYMKSSPFDVLQKLTTISWKRNANSNCNNMYQWHSHYLEYS